MKAKIMILIGLPMIAITYGFARFSYGLVLPYLREDLGMSQALAGAIASSAYFSYIIAIILAMIFMQKWGARRLILVSGATAVIGMAIIALANNDITLAVGIFIAGISSAFASPSYADGVKRWIQESEQAQVNTWINSGTSVGTAITGIIVIFLASDWRLTFIIFTVLGLVVLGLNYKYIPKEKSVSEASKIRLKKSEFIEAIPLIIASTLLGVGMAGYWTFSRDLVSSMAGIPDFIDQGFWIIIGLAGIIGGFAGRISNKIGLTPSHWLGVIVIGAASLLLGLFSNPASVVLSAIAFGSAYIFVCGILILWGINIFKDDPSVGVGVTYSLLTLGQFFGAIFGGIIAASQGYQSMFVIFGLITMISLIFKPKKQSQTNIEEQTDVV